MLKGAENEELGALRLTRIKNVKSLRTRYKCEIHSPPRKLNRDGEDISNEQYCVIQPETGLHYKLTFEDLGLWADAIVSLFSFCLITSLIIHIG